MSNSKIALSQPSPASSQSSPASSQSNLASGKSKPSLSRSKLAQKFSSGVDRIKNKIPKKSRPNTSNASNASNISSSSRSSSTQTSRPLTERELLNAESALGRTIFGPVPAGHQREFFHYHHNVWLWHESWISPAGSRRAMTVRYEVRPAGVFKRIGRSSYHKITGSELANFRRATHRYLDLVKEKLYK